MLKSKLEIVVEVSRATNGRRRIPKKIRTCNPKRECNIVRTQLMWRDKHSEQTSQDLIHDDDGNDGGV
jgi:hypothetical protein